MTGVVLRRRIGADVAGLAGLAGINGGEGLDEQQRGWENERSRKIERPSPGASPHILTWTVLALSHKGSSGGEVGGHWTD